MYVEELVGANTVNTLPPETIEACADHCKISDHLRSGFDRAEEVLAQVAALGIDLDKVMAELLDEGIKKFIDSFTSLMRSLSDKVAQLTPV
jgi:transaldolase